MNSAASGAPPATKLEGEDNEAAARGAKKLGLRSLLARRAYRRAAPRNLRAWERIGNDLEAAVILAIDDDIEVAQEEDIGGNGSAGFAAEPGCGPLKRDSRKRKSPTRGQAARWSPY